MLRRLRYGFAESPVLEIEARTRLFSQPPTVANEKGHDMNTPVVLAEDRRAEDLLLTTLAVLSLRGVDFLRTTDKSFHHRFAKALEVFRASGGEEAELASSYHEDVVSKTYDQLDHALIAAEQLGWVKFPNPSYTRLQITITPRDARRLLSEWSTGKEPFEKAADALLQESR